MKKFYLTVLALSTLSFASFGQYDNDGMLRAKTKSESVNGVSVYSTKAPGDVIGSVMDFSDATNWVIDNENVTGTGWVIGADAPAGPYSGGMGPINSTSGADFALFDSDANPGTGYLTMANPIDLSGEANVAFEFESYYRNFQGSAFFEISIDSNTWESYEVHASLPLNESTSNPREVSVNISNIAANEATVWARFRYESSAPEGDYAWMVDDVKFSEGYDDELILEDLFMTAGAEQLDYYQIPTNLLQDFTYGARLENGGINDQTNTTLNVRVNDGNSDIYNKFSESITVTALEKDSLAVTENFTAPEDGNYITTFNLESADATDQKPSNNTATLEPIQVGGNVYARDNGIISGSTGFLGGTPVETKVGQYFEFPSEFFIGEIEVRIADVENPEEVAGDEVVVQLTKLNEAGDAFDIQAESNPYEIQADDFGSYIRLPLIDGGYTTEPGDIIEVLAGHFGSENIRFSSAQIGFGAVIYSDGDRFAQNSLYHVRPVSPSASLENQNQKKTGSINVYPNPVENNFKLTYGLSSSSDVEIEVRDVTGKVVHTLNETTVKKGRHVVDLDASSFNSGVYVAVVKSDNTIAQRKFIVK